MFFFIGVTGIITQFVKKSLQLYYLFLFLELHFLKDKLLNCEPRFVPLEKIHLK